MKYYKFKVNYNISEIIEVEATNPDIAFDKAAKIAKEIFEDELYNDGLEQIEARI